MTHIHNNSYKYHLFFLLYVYDEFYNTLPIIEFYNSLLIIFLCIQSEKKNQNQTDILQDTII